MIRKSFSDKFCHFIPQYVSNTVVSACYTLMSRLQMLLSFIRMFFVCRFASVRSSVVTNLNFTENQTAFARHFSEIQNTGGYIENQRSYANMTYGSGTMSASGCGIFAVFNALSFLNHTSVPDLPNLIRDFEQNGMVLNGTGGTAPRAIQKYLTRNGVSNKYTTKRQGFHALASESRCIILTMFNDRNDIRKQMHTICITKQPMPFDTGCRHPKEILGYTAHNVTGNGSVVGPYSSFQELMENINDGKSKVFFMIGIL